MDELRVPRHAFNLLETSVALAVAAATAASLLLALPRRATAAHDAYLVVQAQIAQAREIAKTSGNGATFVLVPKAATFTSAVYAGRPNGGTFAATPIDEQTQGVTAASNLAGSNPLALFFSASSTVTGASWSVGSGTLSTQPACTGPITITFTAGTQSVSGSIGCSDPRFI
jgi:hypothetical protein